MLTPHNEISRIWYIFEYEQAIAEGYESKESLNLKREILKPEDFEIIGGEICWPMGMFSESSSEEPSIAFDSTGSDLIIIV